MNKILRNMAIVKILKKMEKDRPRTLLYAAFYSTIALFFLLPAMFFFVMGLFAFEAKQPDLLPWVGIILTIFGLGNTALLKTLEEDTKETKRLAFSVSFIVIGLLGIFWAGMLFRSLFDSSGTFPGPEWISSFLEFLYKALVLFLVLFFVFFLTLPYYLSASHYIGIVLKIGEKSGVIQGLDEEKG